MIILLHGPDEYLRLQKKNELITEFRKKHDGVAVGRFDLAEKDEFARFVEFVGSQSLFDPKKLAILDNIFSAEGGAEEKDSQNVFKESAKNPNITILVSEKNKSSEKLTFLARKSVNIKLQKFDYLEGAEWIKFISELAKENEATLQPEALKFLAEVYQNDTWGLRTELQKIALLPKKNIELKDLEKLGLEVSPDFYGLLGGLKNQELDKRLASLEKLFLLNAPMFKVFNMIAYQIPDKLGQMAKYDILVKSGKLDYEEVLVDFVI